MSYTVYCHTNKLNNKKYIGITKQKPERRWQNGAGYEKTYFGNAIKKYGWDNFTHEILFTELTKQEACEKEIELIKKYDTANKEKGYNIALGGQTCDYITGKYDIEHPNHKRVKMIDMSTNQVIKIFGSQASAAKELGIERKCITKACQGILQSYKGYIWEYADISYQKPIHNGIGNYEHKAQRKAIMVINTDGKKEIFNSIQEAAERYSIKHSNICRFLSGVRKDKTGRRWLYCL